jgi:hypothetical protein
MILPWADSCDVDCDVTPLRIGVRAAFCTSTQLCAVALTIHARTSEAPENPEACWHSRSTAHTDEQSAMLAYKREVRGSSPRPPTNRIKGS